MAKFRGNVQPKVRLAHRRGPVQTVAQDTITYEGAAGFSRDPKSDLFLLGVTNMVGEDTFYEDGSARDTRVRMLVEQVTKSDPEWMQAFIPWLRNDAFMRTASIVCACEYVRNGGPNGRQVLASALKRADEPAVALGYWLSMYGKTEPKPFKRGVADACERLFNEYNAQKWDSSYADVRLGDVIERVHPRARDAAQGEVYRWLLCRAHKSDEIRVDWEKIPMLRRLTELEAVPPSERRAMLRDQGTGSLADGGLTWERLSGWLPDGMDAFAWNMLILSGQLPYMATLRNLRNFERAGISAEARKAVIAKLTDPAEVARSMQFPFRFLSAYNNTTTHDYSEAIEEALGLSCANVPALPGRTLVLIDVSGSMMAPVSQKSTVPRWQIGALFGLVANRRFDECDVACFASSHRRVELPRTGAILRGFDKVRAMVGTIGYGTEMFRALDAHFDRHDRVVIFTDEQTRGHAGVTPDVLYAFNLGGYAPAAFDFTTGRYELGGFSDQTFRLMTMLEKFQRDATWPWES